MNPACQISLTSAGATERAGPQLIEKSATSSASAALDAVSGSVIAQHYRRHRHQEFLRSGR
jgi:hypothetical protein